MNTHSKSTADKTIGIIGGVGPYAGLDVTQKIFANTVAQCDQEHLSVILFSKSIKIADRTEYLLQPEKFENPGVAMGKIALDLQRAGATIIGIPCNTAHSSTIFKELESRITTLAPPLKLINMITETFNALLAEQSHLKKIGLLATKGTHFSKVYEQAAASLGLTILTPEVSEQAEVHAAIYNSTYGIKAKYPVTTRAIKTMETISLRLCERGAEAIIMGCTEIPLAMEQTVLPVPKVDPTEVLARALIYHVAPHKLKPLND